MPVKAGETSVAAATAILGYDLLSGEIWKKASYARILTGVALTGSAAAGDSAVEVYANADLLVKKFNTTTGFPTRDHIVPINALIPPGAELAAKVVDAPATSPINLLLLFA